MAWQAQSEQAGVWEGCAVHTAQQMSAVTKLLGSRFCSSVEPLCVKGLKKDARHSTTWP